MFRPLLVMALLVSTLALAPAHAQSTGTTVSVIRVVDGDTVDVAFDDGRVERLRLIGIARQKWLTRASPKSPSHESPSSVTRQR